MTVLDPSGIIVPRSLTGAVKRAVPLNEPEKEAVCENRKKSGKTRNFVGFLKLPRKTWNDVNVRNSSNPCKSVQVPTNTGKRREIPETQNIPKVPQCSPDSRGKCSYGACRKGTANKI